MKTSIFLKSLALSISLIGLVTSPTLGEQTKEVSTQQSSNQEVVIPKSAVLSVKSVEDLRLDAGIDKDYPVTLYLDQPLYGSYGNLIAPKNSLIEALIKPANSGILITAKSLILRGQRFPLQAHSDLIPSRNMTVKSGIDKAKEHSSVASRVAVGVSSALGGNPDDLRNTVSIAHGLGALIGALSPEEKPEVIIPQGRVYNLTLETSVAIPLLAAPQAPTPQGDSK